MDALASVLGRLAEGEAGQALAALYLEQGNILSSHLNRVDEAVEAYAKALGCMPDITALDELIDITRERELKLATLLEEPNLPPVKTRREFSLNWAKYL